jgi:hypothetical protein
MRERVTLLLWLRLLSNEAISESWSTKFMDPSWRTGCCLEEQSTMRSLLKDDGERSIDGERTS